MADKMVLKDGSGGFSQHAGVFGDPEKTLVLNPGGTSDVVVEFLQELGVGIYGCAVLEKEFGPFSAAFLQLSQSLTNVYSFNETVADFTLIMSAPRAS
jgi:hypothetical protein